MMKFSTLWSLDRTVDPRSGRSPIADAIAANWEHDPGSVRFFRSSANFIYTLEHHGRLAYLRIAASSERSMPAIATEIDMLGVLYRAGLPVVRPIPTSTGTLIATQGNETDGFLAVLFEGIGGRQRELEDLSIDDMQSWGATVGRLHVALKAVPMGHARVPAWQSTLTRIKSGQGSVPECVRAEGARLQAVLQSLPVNPDTYGLLHNDLELDNLAWDGDVISILDFDDYGNGWYLLDVAKALTDLLAEGDTVDSPRIVAFVAGYRRHHDLDDEMLDVLPDFLALSKLRGYASVVRAMDIDEEEAEADWMRHLIHRLRAWMVEYERSLELASEARLGVR